MGYVFGLIDYTVYGKYGQRERESGREGSDTHKRTLQTWICMYDYVKAQTIRNLIVYDTGGYRRTFIRPIIALYQMFAFAYEAFLDSESILVASIQCFRFPFASSYSFQTNVAFMATSNTSHRFRSINGIIDHNHFKSCIHAPHAHACFYKTGYRPCRIQSGSNLSIEWHHKKICSAHHHILD